VAPVAGQDPAQVPPTVPAASPAPPPSLANKSASADLSASPKKLKGDSSLAKSNRDSKPILVAASSKEENDRASSSIGAGNLVASGAIPKALPAPAPVASETVENTFGLRQKKATQGVQ